MTVAEWSRLDSEHDLAESLGVSRPTIRQALRDLHDRGLVVRRKGVGTTIVGPATAAVARPALKRATLPRRHRPDLENPFFSGLVHSIERGRSPGRIAPGGSEH